MEKVINIFHYDWSIQIHTVNIIQKFCEEGYNVNVFVCNCSEQFISLKDMSNDTINIYYYPNIKESFIYKKINSLYYLFFNEFFFVRKFDRNALLWALSHIKTINSNIYIGIEKKGLIWAGKVNDQIKGKLIYYSLELYEKDPEWIEKNEFNYLRKLEKEFHKKTSATVIQDKFRATNIFRYNDFPVTDVLYLPVSLRREKNYKFSIKDKKNNIIVLYLGKIAKHRFVEEICEIACNNELGYKYWIHGPCDADYLKQLVKKYASKNLKISNNLIEFPKIPQMIDNVTIGICFYRINNLNDRLTAFSSEKIALFLSQGIPIITFKNESYDYLFENFKCGVSILSFDQIETAVKIILDDYEFYCENANFAFEKYFNFDNVVKDTLNYVKQC